MGVAAQMRPKIGLFGGETHQTSSGNALEGETNVSLSWLLVGKFAMCFYKNWPNYMGMDAYWHTLVKFLLIFANFHHIKLQVPILGCFWPVWASLAYGKVGQGACHRNVRKMVNPFTD